MHDEGPIAEYGTKLCPISAEADFVGVSSYEAEYGVFQSRVSRVFDRVFHRGHNRVGGAGSAEDIRCLREIFGQRGRFCGNYGSLREGGKAFMYAVHPKVGVRPRVDFPIKMQVPAVRPVYQQKSARFVAKRAEKGEIGKVAVVIGRGDQEGVRTLDFFSRLSPGRL